jgi:hypothetical protein
MDLEAFVVGDIHTMAGVALAAVALVWLIATGERCQPGRESVRHRDTAAGRRRTAPRQPEPAPARRSRVRHAERAHRRDPTARGTISGACCGLNSDRVEGGRPLSGNHRQGSTALRIGAAASHQPCYRTGRTVCPLLHESQPAGLASQTLQQAVIPAASPARCHLRESCGGRARAPSARRRVDRVAHSRRSLACCHTGPHCWPRLR